MSEFVSRLASKNASKILFWVFDGVGGLPHPETGKTELEGANIPFLDAFAKRGAGCGLEPVGAGITPGSGPGHMGIFGYEVKDIELPRGILEVLGAETILQNGEPVRFELQPGDLAARGNFATLKDGLITDRRAGKPSTATSKELVKKLSKNLFIEGVKIFFIPGEQHRFAILLRGKDIHGPLTDGDPQRTGLAPVWVEPLEGGNQRAADLINNIRDQATQILEDEARANTVLLRGIGNPPTIPSLESLYGIRCAAIATYPMYKGIARMVGMDILPVNSLSHEEEVDVLEKYFDDYDFFYLHIKETDSYGHTGDFKKKMEVLEECDPLFERARKLGFDVVVVTGDHCTPCLLEEHSWHPIPTVVWSKTVMPGSAEHYCEREVYNGSYGIRPSKDLMPLVLAEAGRLKKFGA